MSGKEENAVAIKENRENQATSQGMSNEGYNHKR